MEEKYFIEEPNTIPVYAQCDVLVVGGGCAGHSAAVAAARAGCKNVILMERYGYSGGDVTGAYVLMVPKLSWKTKSFCRGIQEEWFTRLLENDPTSVVGPRMDEIGSTDPALIHRWKGYMDCVSDLEPKNIVRSLFFDGEQLKIDLDNMLVEHSDCIKIMYHCWATKPIMDDDTIKGVIFESKTGRMAVFAKIVIDATGDGDLYSQTGAPYFSLSDAGTRSTTTTLAWRLGGVHGEEWTEWKQAHPQAAAALRKRIVEIAGYPTGTPGNAKPHDISIVTNHHPNKDCSKIKDLTDTELVTRASIPAIIEILKEVCPIAFKDCYLVSVAPQTGVRCSRRLDGEYVMTPDDFAFATKFDDVIAWESTICKINDCGPVEIPYRCILPKKIENLLCPGRHLSADDVAIDWLNLIPQCIATGQAAGVAAAVAVGDGATAKTVDIKKVQDILVDQDVPLPRNDKTDPSYTQLCEENEYGLYTELAKKAREDREAFKSYRQW